MTKVDKSDCESTFAGTRGNDGSPKAVFAHLRTLSELYFRRAAATASGHSLCSFAVQQNALAFDAPSIAGERTVAANDTMAGNGDGKIVRGARSCHGADRRRCANALRNLRIGDRRADWDFLERLPHASLESSAANIKGKIQANPRRLDEPDYPSHQGFVVTIGADEMRPREAVLKVAHEFVRIVSEKDGRDAFLARGDQNGAQTGLANRELDLLVCTARAVLRWGHAEHASRLLVKAPARIETRVVDGFGDAAARSQSLPDLRRAVGGGVVFGRDTGGGLGQAVEIGWAATDHGRQHLQRRLLFVLLDYSAGSRDEG